MTSKTTYVRVGLLLAAGLAGLVGLVLFLSRDQVRNGLNYETYFRESVQGLVVGAPVKYRGVSLGQVQEIALVGAMYPEAMPAKEEQASYQLVVVRFTIDPKRIGHVLDPVRAVELGLRARLASQGITGVTYVELDFIKPQQFPAETVPWTPYYDYIPAMPSTIAQVQDAATALLAKLQAVDFARIAADAQTVLEDLHAQLTEGDMHGALAEAHTLLRTLRVAVDQADLPGLAADLRATSGSFRTLAQGKQVRQITDSAAQAADNLAEASRRLPALLSALETAVKRADDGVGDLQHELEPLLRDAGAAAANLRETSDTLRRYPSSVLLGAPPPKERTK